MRDVKMYFCIDLKTFYASVECVERNLDPFSTNLVVADPSRGKGAICLAISPALKNMGIRNRCRLYEIPDGVEYIIAKPRMKKYIEYSANVYAVYLKYISKDDIHPYSIDEMFLDVTKYLKLYKTSANNLAKMILDDVLKTTGITATCGIGPNMFLAKVALDITAKHTTGNIAFLDEKKFHTILGNHRPLTDFWHIGKGTQDRLSKLGLHTLNDILTADENLLYKEFGVNAKILIDHAHGIEPTTIADIKKYEPMSTSLSISQVLFEDYTYEKTKIVLTEMVDTLCLQLVEQNVVCSSIGLSIHYSKESIPSTGGSKKLKMKTNAFSILNGEILKLFEQTTNKNAPIRKLGVTMGDLLDESYEYVDIFTDRASIKKEKEVAKTVNEIKHKFGKNAILRGTSLKEGATQKIRNKLIGGHNGE